MLASSGGSELAWTEASFCFQDAGLPACAICHSSPSRLAQANSSTVPNLGLKQDGSPRRNFPGVCWDVPDHSGSHQKPTRRVKPRKFSDLQGKFTRRGPHRTGHWQLGTEAKEGRLV